MSDDNEKNKAEVERLARLERMIDRYVQSRSLGLLIPLVIIIINVGLLIGAGKLISWMPAWWSLGILFLMMAWVSVGSLWLTVKLVAKYEYSFYRRDGKIEFEREKIPVWAWGAYLISFCGVTLLSAYNVMSVRWGLTSVLAILAVFVLYVSGKEKNKLSGIVFSILMSAGAILAASGTLSLFTEKGWLHSFFVPLLIYFIGAMVITVIVSHLYNRKILRKIKAMRPFGEQEANKSDT